MTTQDQKNRKIATAEKQVADVQAKVTKNTEALTKLEADYQKARLALVAKGEALAPELAEAQAHLEWVQSMPVSGKASGEVGAIETPVADALDDNDEGNVSNED